MYSDIPIVKHISEYSLTKVVWYGNIGPLIRFWELAVPAITAATAADVPAFLEGFWDMRVFSY